MKKLRTLPQALADAAQSRAGYVFVDGRGEQRRSYAEMHQAAQAWAGNPAIGLLVTDDDIAAHAVGPARVGGGETMVEQHPGVTGADQQPLFQGKLEAGNDALDR